MVEEIKKVLEEESGATPNMFVNRARNNKWNLNRQTFCNVMKELNYHYLIIK